MRRVFYHQATNDGQNIYFGYIAVFIFQCQWQQLKVNPWHWMMRWVFYHWATTTGKSFCLTNWLFLFSCACSNSWTWTLKLEMRRWVFYHCLPKIIIYLFASFILCQWQKLEMWVFYHCTTTQQQLGMSPWLLEYLVSIVHRNRSKL